MEFVKKEKNKYGYDMHRKVRKKICGLWGKYDERLKLSTTTLFVYMFVLYEDYSGQLLSPVKTRGYRVELVPSVCLSVCPA